MAHSTIEGSIATPAGDPIAGANVCAYATTPGLPDELSRYPRCTRSADDGRYALENLAPLAYTVQATARGFFPATHEPASPKESQSDPPGVQLRPGQSARDIDLILEPGGVLISGIVKDMAGGVLEGALVMAEANFFRPVSGVVAMSDAEGRFELSVPPGQVELVAQRPDYAAGHAELFAPGDPVTILMAPGSMLVGKVVDASTGESVAGARVRANPLLRVLGRGPPRDAKAVTDAEGRFALENLAPGRYSPVADARGYHGKFSGSVRLGLAEIRAPIVIEARAGPTLDVNVADGSGNPAAGCTVSLKHQTSARRLSETSDDAGSIAFDYISPGTYDVSVVACRGHTPRETYPPLEVGGTQNAPVTLEVDPGCTLTGRVLDRSQKPVPRAHIRVDRDGRSWGVPVRSDGTFFVSGLPTGMLEVSVTSPSHLDAETMRLDLGEGVTEETFILDDGASVRGRTIDRYGQSVPEVPIELDGPEHRTGRSNARGEFLVEGLPAGTYEIVASGETARDAGAGPRTIDLMSGGRAEVELTVAARTGRIRGRVVEDGGPVTDALVVAHLGSEPGSLLSSDVPPVLTDLDGRFSLEGLQEGRYFVRAYQPGGAEAVLENVETNAEEVELTCQPTAGLQGTLRNADGAPLDAFVIWLHREQTGLVRHEKFEGTGGRWFVDDLPPGKWGVTARVDEREVKATVELKPEDLRTLDLAL